MRNSITRVLPATGSVLILVFSVLAHIVIAHAADVSCQDSVVAGSPDQFMMVRHVVLRGSNYAIGKALGEMVSKSGESGILPSDDHRRSELRRKYMAESYPVLYERMKGLADAFDVGIDDNSYDLSSLPQLHIFGPGCSAVYYPGGFTENGHDILSRNFDFTSGTIMGTQPQGGQLPALARPYVFEIYPDQGYASIAICAFELLGGVLDGMNSEGLTVAIFADDETVSEFGLHASQGVGLHELQSMRYLLDNCRNVEEAKEAMLYHKHYYSFVPCHYLIADGEGNSFVFEFSALGNGTSIIEGTGPQCITNHPLSKYSSVDELPKDSELSTYRRYRTLRRAVETKDKFSLEEIISINSSVAVPPTAIGNQDYAPGRTLWHSLYDIDERSLRVKFYLGEEPEPDGGEATLEYTPYLEFVLGE